MKNLILIIGTRKKRVLLHQMIIVLVLGLLACNKQETSRQTEKTPVQSKSTDKTFSTSTKKSSEETSDTSAKKSSEETGRTNTPKSVEDTIKTSSQQTLSFPIRYSAIPWGRSYENILADLQAKEIKFTETLSSLPYYAGWGCRFYTRAELKYQPTRITKGIKVNISSDESLTDTYHLDFYKYHGTYILFEYNKLSKYRGDSLSHNAIWRKTIPTVTTVLKTRPKTYETQDDNIGSFKCAVWSSQPVSFYFRLGTSGFVNKNAYYLYVNHILYKSLNRESVIDKNNRERQAERNIKVDF